MDTSGKAFVEHWSWASEKGLMNQHTASGLRAACSQVLSIEDGWEELDVRTLEVEEILRRFTNLKSKDFKPRTVNVYKRRFMQALASFLEYVDDPAGWKPKVQERGARENAGSRQKGRQQKEQIPPQPAPTHRDEMKGTNLVEYPYPLREGVMARLVLPRDLKGAEVKRLTAFMTTLVVDTEESPA